VPVAWGVFILALTSVPNPNLPGGFHADKLGHFAMYAVLGVLSVRALGPRMAVRALVGILVGAAIFGAFDEWHQQFIPGRSLDRADWFADALGASFGVMLSAAIRSRRESST
jgi:VanZ family protein